jgi:hypothetical protein
MGKKMTPGQAATSRNAAAALARELQELSQTFRKAQSAYLGSACMCVSVCVRLGFDANSLCVELKGQEERVQNFGAPAFAAAGRTASVASDDGDGDALDFFDRVRWAVGGMRGAYE